MILCDFLFWMVFFYRDKRLLVVNNVYFSGFYVCSVFLFALCRKRGGFLGNLLNKGVYLSVCRSGVSGFPLYNAAFPAL